MKILDNKGPSYLTGSKIKRYTIVGYGKCPFKTECENQFVNFQETCGGIRRKIIYKERNSYSCLWCRTYNTEKLYLIPTPPEDLEYRLIDGLSFNENGVYDP
jgi:hypothetical protein